MKKIIIDFIAQNDYLTLASVAVLGICLLFAFGVIVWAFIKEQQNKKLPGSP